MAKDAQIQLAIRAINGPDICSFSEREKEHAAKAIECGYLYREGNKIYTKILVNNVKDNDRLFEIINRLCKGYFETEAEIIAGKLEKMIRKMLPDYLHKEWEFFNYLAGMPVLDYLVEVLIEKGVLTPPEDGIGAEGYWMSVSRE